MGAPDCRKLRAHEFFREPSNKSLNISCISYICILYKLDALLSLLSAVNSFSNLMKNNFDFFFFVRI